MSEQKQLDKQFAIPLSLAQATVRYLEMRPYVEVYQLIAAFLQLPEMTAASLIVPVENTEEKKEEKENG